MFSKSLTRILQVLVAVCLTAAAPVAFAGGPDPVHDPPAWPDGPPLEVAHGNNPPAGSDGGNGGHQLGIFNPTPDAVYMPPLLDASTYQEDLSFWGNKSDQLTGEGVWQLPTPGGSFQSVPAPGPLALIGLSVLALGGRRRRAAG